MDKMDISHWLGAEANASIIGAVIATGGIPAVNHSDYIVMDRIWAPWRIEYILGVKPEDQAKGETPDQCIFCQAINFGDDDILAVQFIKKIGIFPPGSIVQTRNGDYAVVIKPGVECMYPKICPIMGPCGTPYKTFIEQDSRRRNSSVPARTHAGLPR